jgi:hypothetical protein
MVSLAMYLESNVAWYDVIWYIYVGDTYQNAEVGV